MERNPLKKEVIAEARKIVRLVQFNTYIPDEEETEHLWKVLDEHTRRANSQNLKLEIKRSRRKAPMMLAASIALILSFSIVFYLNRDFIRYQKITTGYGQVSSHVLPDGTEVLLNANSSLKVAHDWPFSDWEREVIVTGEAHFKVTKKETEKGEKLRFKVYTPDLKLEVLGTVFNVNTRRQQTTVVLSEGKVKLDLPKGDEILMIPGEKVAFSKANDKLKVEQVRTDLYTSWSRNELIFEESTLKEVAELLEDEYGLKVIFEDSSLQNHRIRGTFEAGKIDVLLKAIEELFEIEIETDGNNVTMK